MKAQDRHVQSVQYFSTIFHDLTVQGRAADTGGDGRAQPIANTPPALQSVSLRLMYQTRPVQPGE